MVQRHLVSSQMSSWVDNRSGQNVSELSDCQGRGDKRGQRPCCREYSLRGGVERAAHAGEQNSSGVGGGLALGTGTVALTSGFSEPWGGSPVRPGEEGRAVARG